MKRSVLARTATCTATCAALLAVAGLAGCKGESPRARNVASAASDWQRPPVIKQVRWAGQSVVLSGEAEPNGRVVFSSGDGSIHAANADGEGRFSVDLDIPASGLMLKPRSQMGQTFIDGQGVFYLVPSAGALAVNLLDGEASRRLGGKGLLDSVDSDGSALILSGHVRGKALPQVTVGENSFRPRPDADGRWVVATTGGLRSTELTIDGQAYVFPGTGRPESPAGMVGGGWLITRDLGGKAVQTTWLPVDM